MPNLDLSILVVDDAKFSSTIIGKVLKKAGYRDIRFADSARSALNLLEQRPASVLLADWLMPEMDGLELTSRVRQLDESANHFTYIILLTAREGVEALAEAFDNGVDDFINKSEMSQQLLARIYAADRTSDEMNSLLMANQLLIDNNMELEDKNTVDLVTGLANQRYARKRFKELLAQTESRGGAASYMLMGIRNWSPLSQRFDRGVMDELAVGIARRLRHLVRPLDVVARVGDNLFVVIKQFADIEHCTPLIYRRIHEGIDLKAFKTTMGFISVETGSCVCVCDNKTDMPDSQAVETVCNRGMQDAFAARTVSLNLWHEVRDSLAEDSTF